MRFDILAVIAFAGFGMAAKTIPSGEKCKKDGSMGNCESKVCIQGKNADMGKCK